MTTNHTPRSWRHIAVTAIAAAAIGGGACVATGNGVASADEGTSANNGPTHSSSAPSKSNVDLNRGGFGAGAGSLPGTDITSGIGIGGTASASKLASNPGFAKAISSSPTMSTF
jgi:hypothetical protein